MIHAHIDALSTKNIIGFECGTRKDFDTRHGGDPLWVFFDQEIVEFRLKTEAFFQNPKNFYIDANGVVQMMFKQDLIEEVVYPLGPNGKRLKDTRGNFVTLPVPPGFVYITDSDNAVIIDDDGAYIVEAI